MESKSTPKHSVSLHPMMHFQHRAHSWVRHCFGRHSAESQGERAYRFLEEAIELAQACRISRVDARRLVDRVYMNPEGSISQEVGGVVVTLAALSASAGVDFYNEGLTEMARIESPDIIEKCRYKNIGKLHPGNLDDAEGGA